MRNRTVQRAIGGYLWRIGLIGLLLLAGCQATAGALAFEDLYSGNLASVSHVLIRDGNTGEAVTTADPARIAEALDLIGSLNFTRQRDQAPRSGWRYYVDLYTGEADTFRVTFSGRTAGIDGAYYDLDRDISEELTELYQQMAPAP